MKPDKLRAMLYGVQGGEGESVRDIKSRPPAGKGGGPIRREATAHSTRRAPR